MLERYVMPLMLLALGCGLPACDEAASHARTRFAPRLADAHAARVPPGAARHDDAAEPARKPIELAPDGKGKKPPLARRDVLLDRDGDGVEDDDDRCTALAGVKTNAGCPADVQEDALASLEAAMRLVQFRPGSAELLPSSRPSLSRVARVLSDYPRYSLLIEGHTDARGPRGANLRLSIDRAAACRQELVELGIDAERLRPVGFGETRPRADNRTPGGRARNRRVEFQLMSSAS